jgi:hypothetical protein
MIALMDDVHGVHVGLNDCAVHDYLGGVISFMSMTLQGSVVDPKLFFSGSGSYLDLNSGFESGSGLFMKNKLEIQIIYISQ